MKKHFEELAYGRCDEEGCTSAARHSWGGFEYCQRHYVAQLEDEDELLSGKIT